MLTSYVFLPIFIQIVNVLNVQFQGPIGAAAVETGRRTIPIATISRGVRNGGRVPFAKICQGVLTYSLMLSEIHRISFSPIALFVCVYLCVCMCVCVCVCVYVCVCVFIRLNVSLLDRTKKSEVTVVASRDRDVNILFLPFDCGRPIAQFR